MTEHNWIDSKIIYACHFRFERKKAKKKTESRYFYFCVAVCCTFVMFIIDLIISLLALKKSKKNSLFCFNERTTTYTYVVYIWSRANEKCTYAMREASAYSQLCDQRAMQFFFYLLIHFFFCCFQERATFHQ